MSEPIKLPPLTLSMLMEVFGSHADIPPALLDTSWKDGIDIDNPSRKAQELVRLAVEQVTAELRALLERRRKEHEATFLELAISQRKGAEAVQRAEAAAAEVERLREMAGKWESLFQAQARLSEVAQTRADKAGAEVERLQEALEGGVEAIDWLTHHLSAHHGCLHMDPDVSGIPSWIANARAALKETK